LSTLLGKNYGHVETNIHRNSYETVTTDISPFKIKANKEGKYRINSVRYDFSENFISNVRRDSHCSGVANGSATVTMYKLPSATIRVKSPEMTNWEQLAKICEGGEAQVFMYSFMSLFFALIIKRMTSIF
jgi:hypothetical protein